MQLVGGARRVRRGAQSERGAVAVIVAVIAMLLFAGAAIAVDLGNAFVRKRDVQAQADFAALAAADDLSKSSTKSAADPVVIRVRDYLNENQPQDDKGITAVTADQLVDLDESNGEVYFLPNDSLRVVAPPAQVSFGFGAALGFNKTDVRAAATVQIRSRGNILPFYAIDGCDHGPQTITDPTNGQATGLNLAFAGDSNNAVLTSITPNQLPVNGSSGLQIVGSSFAGGQPVTQVGFFRNDGATLHAVAATPTDDQNITVAAIPSTVTSVEDVWYVRVYKNGRWSPKDDALPLRIGSAVLECLAGSNDGNFGSLKLPRNDSNNSTGDGWLPINIAKGLQEPLTLAVFPGSPPPSTCSESTYGAVVSDQANLRPGTNCVDTDTGLTDNSATAGFITGTSNQVVAPGRLDKDTTPGCGADPADRNRRWNTGINRGGGQRYEINDDLLTCFFTNDSTTIGQISSETYAGPTVLSDDIYKSPRFFWQPVLGVDPSSGGSLKYSIVDFRPGFLADQPLTANRVNNEVGTSTQHNGITIDNGRVKTVKVIFFDVDALPRGDDGSPTVGYLGFGPRVIRLVD